jgi:hypothetical protein
VSTAVYDPKWYHDFKTGDYVFKDKRGIINGLRVGILSPYKIENVECKSCVNKDTTTCSFIKQYRDYIFSLDFNEVYSYLMNISHQCNNADICLMVYEKPDNPCSERATLVEWFANNGVILMEFSKS